MASNEYQNEEDLMSDTGTISALPDNLLAMLTLSDMYGEPFVCIAHREDDNDDTAVFSLQDFRILAGHLTTTAEEERMARWVERNVEYLLLAWNKNQPKIIEN